MPSSLLPPFLRLLSLLSSGIFNAWARLGEKTALPCDRRLTSLRNHTFKTFADIWDSSKKYTGHLEAYKLASKTGLTDWQILDLSSLQIKFLWYHPWSGQAGSQQNSCQILSQVYPRWIWLSLPPSLIAELPEWDYMDCHISLRTGKMARVGLELTRVPFPELRCEPHNRL